MPTPMSHHSDKPSTYFVQDQSLKSLREELARLDFQGQMLTADMGGVLPEQPDLARFQRVLDLGCGTGNWLIELAKTSLETSLLVGVDINPKMVEYAQTQAAAQQVGERVQFRTMDVLGTLAFAAESFDLVNQRLGHSYVRTWEWPFLLSECQRVLAPGGVIRLTEVETVPQSSSAAVDKLGHILIEALYEAGHSFTPDRHGITEHLARLLRVSGLLQQVQTRIYTLNYRGGTVEGERFAHGLKQLFRTTLPFAQKWTHVPDNYEEIYRQAQRDMQSSDFVATWQIFAAWGNKPA